MAAELNQRLDRIDNTIEKIETELVKTDEKLSAILAGLDNIRDEQREQRARLSSIEHTLAQEFAHTRLEFARLDARFDRVHDRLERIERRLGLIDGAEG